MMVLHLRIFFENMVYFILLFILCIQVKVALLLLAKALLPSNSCREVDAELKKLPKYAPAAHQNRSSQLSTQSPLQHGAASAVGSELCQTQDDREMWNCSWCTFENDALNFPTVS